MSYRDQVTSQPELPGAWNFRDVSQTTGALRPGRLFRSSELSRLDERGREQLRQIGVGDVADLRSPREVTRRGPGLVPDGVDIHLLPFPDLAGDQSPDSSAPHEDAFRNMMAEKPDEDSAADVAARYMLEEYQRFPTLGGSRRAVQRVAALAATATFVHVRPRQRIAWNGSATTRNPQRVPGSVRVENTRRVAIRSSASHQYSPGSSIQRVVRKHVAGNPRSSRSGEATSRLST